jgi:hypothetical protein
MLTAGELRKRFGFSADKLDRLIKQGLPVKGKGAKRQFDARKVAAWLKAQPKTERRKDGETAKTKPPAPQRSSPEQSPAITAATIAEAAGHLKVAPRTLAGWLTDPSFPGKAGSPGKADGYFPIAEIQRWHLATFGVTAAAAARGTKRPRLPSGSRRRSTAIAPKSSWSGNSARSSTRPSKSDSCGE